MLYLDKSKFTLKALEGSASTNDGTLCVTACNTHPTESFTLELETRGANIDEAEVVILKGEDYLSHNTFENPSVVTLSDPIVVNARDGLLHIDMPAASIARVMGKLS